MTSKGRDDVELRLAYDNELIDEMRRRDVPAFAAVLTDEQLLAECDRRKMISGNMAVVDLVRATDEGLRAECERRNLNFESYTFACECGHQSTEFSTSSERDSAQVNHNAVCLTRSSLARERDSWKARYEAAAAARDSALEKLENPVMMVPASLPIVPPNVEGFTFELYRGATTTHYVQSQDCRERGPSASIQAVADERAYANERWGPSDEDLLADDEETKR